MSPLPFTLALTLAIAFTQGADPAPVSAPAAKPAPASSAARHNIEHTKDSLQLVKKNIAGKKAVLVDVRSQEEWNEGHIAGSIFVPITSLRQGGDPKELAKKLPKKKVLYTFCVVGMRAKKAAITLEKHGYTVRPLKPGYEQLLKAGFKKDEQKQEATK